MTNFVHGDDDKADYINLDHVATVASTATGEHYLLYNAVGERIGRTTRDPVQIGRLIPAAAGYIAVALEAQPEVYQGRPVKVVHTRHPVVAWRIDDQDYGAIPIVGGSYEGDLYLEMPDGTLNGGTFHANYANLHDAKVAILKSGQDTWDHFNAKSEATP